MTRSPYAPDALAPRSMAGVYYGWIVLLVAALAMVGTLPGRTQGLGLVTEPLLRDLGISRVAFAQVNLVATLVGSVFCFGIGRLLDRSGSRVVLTLLAAALGATVLAMSRVSGLITLLLLLTLTRGLGQSALSVVSLAMVGKWFRRRLTRAMAVYSVVMSIGFMIAFPLVGAVVTARGWRTAWAGIGLALLAVLAPVAWAFDRSSPDRIGANVDGTPGRVPRGEGGNGELYPPRCRARAGVLGLRSLDVSLWAHRLRDRIVQRVDPGGAGLRG